MRSLVSGVAAALLVVTAGASGAAPRAQAAADQTARNALVADLGLHVIGAGVQRTLAPWVAAQISACYYNPWIHNQDLLGLTGTKSDIEGFVARGRFFFHPFRDAPAGLWISPFGQAGVGFTSQTRSRTGPVGALGVSVGYSLLLRQTVLIGLGLGAQVHGGYFERADRAPTFASFFPHVDANVGFAF